MSCNGCRVLRKGCNDDCPIRPCLDCFKSADAQANATMFLAKFYGRAGLLNLITAGPDHLRPAIFKSLLYEACGRIINPIYGSVGLLWSGNWGRCQTAVDAVLKGTSQYMQLHSSNFGQPAGAMASRTALPALKYSCDIRHIKKSVSSLTSRDHKSALLGTPHKRAKPDPDGIDGLNSGGIWIYPSPIFKETSHHDTEDESNFSAETIEESLTVTAAKLPKTDHQQIWKFGDPVVENKSIDNRNRGVGLDLTLGLTQH